MKTTSNVARRRVLSRQVLTARPSFCCAYTILSLLFTNKNKHLTWAAASPATIRPATCHWAPTTIPSATILRLLLVVALMLPTSTTSTSNTSQPLSHCMQVLHLLL